MRNPGTSERPEESGTANLRYFVQSVVVSLLTYAGKTPIPQQCCFVSFPYKTWGWNSKQFATVTKLWIFFFFCLSMAFHGDTISSLMGKSQQMIDFFRVPLDARRRIYIYICAICRLGGPYCKKLSPRSWSIFKTEVTVFYYIYGPTLTQQITNLFFPSTHTNTPHFANA